MADPQIQLSLLIMNAVRDDDTRMSLARLIDRYARDRRAKNSKPFPSVAVAVDGMINPKPLLFSHEPEWPDQSLLTGWAGLEPQK